MATIYQILKDLPNVHEKNLELLWPEFQLQLQQNPQIATREQIAMFFAQLMHESGGLRYLKEMGGRDYFLKTYGKRKSIIPDASLPVSKWYVGRGPIQITHIFNYEALSADLNLDCVNDPSVLETPANAVASAFWFWNRHKLHSYGGDIKKVTKIINGGYNGLNDRISWYAMIIKQLPK